MILTDEDKEGLAVIVAKLHLELHSKGQSESLFVDGLVFSIWRLGKVIDTDFTHNKERQ